MRSVYMEYLLRLVLLEQRASVRGIPSENSKLNLEQVILEVRSRKKTFSAFLFLALSENPFYARLLGTSYFS